MAKCCGMGSSMSLRGQMILILVICSFICLIISPIIMAVCNSHIASEFEEKKAVANLKRAMVSLSNILKHDEDLLFAYSVWDSMADATDYLLSGDNDTFMDFIRDEYYDFGKWSESTCGSFLAIYNKTTFDEDVFAPLLWSEYHKYNVVSGKLEMDLDNVSPTPSIMLGETEESKRFIREVLSGQSQIGFIALGDEMLVFGCQPIIHSDDPNISHGYLCRANDLRIYLESISVGAGACVSMFNMENSKNIPKRIRESFGTLNPGKRADDNKFVGDVSFSFVDIGGSDDWKEPEWPSRMCGPAELLESEVTTRTVLYFRLQNDFDVSSEEYKGSGFGFIFDGVRDLEPALDKNYIHNFLLLEIFSIVLFAVYGLFTEYAVLRKLDIIAAAAYESLVMSKKEEEEEVDYYVSSRNNKKKEEKGSNEIVRMATLAAETLAKNAIDLKKKKGLISCEKMRSSLAADRLRLLTLYCGRSEEDVVSAAKKRLYGDASDAEKRSLRRRKPLRRSRSLFFQDEEEETFSSAVTLDRVMNDPFALEMFKNYCVKDPISRKIRHPARRCLLFLLCATYFKSLADSAPTQLRIDCIRVIIDEFFTSYSKSGTSGHATLAEDDIGVPDSIRSALYGRGAKCISMKKPSKSLFDDACTAVRNHLDRVVYPAFKKTPVFILIESMFSEEDRLEQKVKSLMQSSRSMQPIDRADGTFNSDSSKKDLEDMENSTDGTKLSHRTFVAITKDTQED